MVIDATGLKVYGEGEWKVKKHGTEGKRRVWRKLHISVDTVTREIVAAELSLSNVTDAEVLPNLLKQTRRKIIEISVDGPMAQGIVTMLCESREQFRSSRHEKVQPSGSKDTLTI